MLVKENFTAGRYDRRIRLMKPVETENEYNETDIEFEIAFSNYPAHRKESVTTDSEQLDGKVVQATNITEWELRFIPNLNIKSTWQLVDMFNGMTYQIISPATEIGRRQALRIKTMVIE